jgi:hypothetical protein
MKTRTLPWLAMALIAIAMLVGLPAAAQAAEPAAPPTADQIKACIKQIDLSGQWTFDWKSIEVGAPRHAQNAYERSGLTDPETGFGYPVRAVYVFNHIETIDARYWATQDQTGRWRIPGLCRP